MLGSNGESLYIPALPNQELAAALDANATMATAVNLIAAVLQVGQVGEVVTEVDYGCS